LSQVHYCKQNTTTQEQTALGQHNCVTLTCTMAEHGNTLTLLSQY